MTSAGRGSQALLALLGLQLVLAGVLYWQSTQTAQFNSGEQLLTLDPAAVDSIHIWDSENQLTLSRSGDDWQLVSDAASGVPLPAEAAQVDKALQSLSTLSSGLPVATTASAQSQLEVADDNFQRHLTLMAGDATEAELYLGTSPGFRKSHTRLAGEVAIHAAKINVFDLPVGIDDWLDKSLLSFSQPSEIAGVDFNLILNEDKWTLVDPAQLPDGKVLNAERIEKLVADLQGLSVTGMGEILLEAEAPDETAENSSAIAETNDTSTGESEEATDTLVETTLRVTDNDQEVVISLSQLGTDATASRDDQDGLFSISTTVFEQLAGLSLEGLLQDIETSPDNAAGDTSAMDDKTEPVEASNE